MQAVILAAGAGTRLEPLTLTMSKVMVPLANKPMLEWVVETAKAVADTVYIVVRRDQLDVIDYFKSKPGIRFIYQDKPLGTGHALLQAKNIIAASEAGGDASGVMSAEGASNSSEITSLREAQASDTSKITAQQGMADAAIDDATGGAAASNSANATNTDFLLMNGDILTTPDNVKALAALPSPAIAGFEMPNPQDFGVLTIRGEGADCRVIELTEKPSKPASKMINAGIYKLNASIFPILENLQKTERDEYELTDALSQLLPMACHTLSVWAHLTHPWDILEANRFVLDTWGPQLGKAEVRPGAYIEQPVAIGEGAILGPNCYIRAYSSIGAGCKVGNAVEIKNSIIMQNSFVSHLSYVGDSIVGRDCNIAAGTIFANLRLDGKTVKMQIKGKVIDTGRRKLGALVGDGVHFGVHCTVMPGRRIWPGILIPPCTIIKNDVTKQHSLKSWKRILT